MKSRKLSPSDPAVPPLRLIGVIGASAAAPRILALAEEVGRLIARRGAALVCGGLGGVMEAACRGAAAEGGLTVGILPGAEHNPFVRLPLRTGLGRGRNLVLVQAAAGFVAVAGGLGTLNEISGALNEGKPVVALESWDLQAAGETPRDLFAKAEDPARAVDLLFAMLDR